MKPATTASVEEPAVARLLIHTTSVDDRSGWSGDSIIQRLFAPLLGGPRRVKAQLGLEIQDFLGHRLLVLNETCPLVDVALSPGTYHVITDLAGTERCYTVALEQGTSVDLYLQWSRDVRLNAAGLMDKPK